MEAFCRENPCALHLLLERSLEAGSADKDSRFTEICDMVTSTVGCPIFRDLPTGNGLLTGAENVEAFTRRCGAGRARAPEVEPLPKAKCA